MRIECLMGLALAAWLSFQSNNAGQTPAVLKGADPAPRDPVEFILDAFDRFQVVALGEGRHMNRQGGALRLQLIRDPRFPRKVRNILVEFGTGRYQDVMDRYIAGEAVPMDRLQMCWRETTQPVIWDAPVYEEFFRAVRDLNQTLPPEARLRILLGDPPIDWTKIRTRSELEAWYNERMVARPWGKSNIRDGHAYDVVVREALSKGQKALVIAGDAHFSKPEISLAPPGFFGDYLSGNLRIQLDHSHPGAALSITTRWDGKELLAAFPEIQRWAKPSLALLKGTKLGALPHGPLKLEDFFDAFLYMGPPDTAGQSAIVHETVADEAYYKEALRRDKLWIGQFQETLIKLRRVYEK